MKKKINKTFVSLGIFGIMALLGMSLVFAYQGEPGVQGPNFSEERHEAMQNAFDDLDYDAWVDLMTENDRHPRIVEVIIEDNFAEFVEARNAVLNGDEDALKEFRESLGLGEGKMRHGDEESLGKRQGKGFGNRQNNCAFAN